MSTVETANEDVERARSLGFLLEGDAFRQNVLADPEARITRMETPFFRAVELYYVYITYLDWPFAFTLGHVEDWATVLLEGNPDGWSQLAESGVNLSTPDLRVAYGATFLEATRYFFTRFQLVVDPTQLGSFEGLTPAQCTELEAARAKVVAPYVSITETAPWIARYYVVQGYSLLRVHLKISADGTIERTDELLQDDVPLPLVF
jgi:hypothetical protein